MAPWLETDLDSPFHLIQECLRLVLIFVMRFVPYSTTADNPRGENIQAFVDTKILSRVLQLYINRYHIENGPGKFHFGVDIRPMLLYIAEKGALLSESIEDQEEFATFFQSLALECAVTNFAEYQHIHRLFFWLENLEFANDARIPRLLDKMATEVRAGRFDLGVGPQEVPPPALPSDDSTIDTNS